MYKIEILYGIGETITYSSEISGLEICDAISRTSSKFWTVRSDKTGETISIFIDSIKHIKSREVE